MNNSLINLMLNLIRNKLKMKFLFNWILPSVFVLSSALNYYVYVYEYCYFVLILNFKKYNLALCYLYIYTLIFILLIWAFVQIVTQKQPKIKQEFKLTHRKIKKLLLDCNNSAFIQDISSTDGNDYTRINPKSNEILESYIKKLNLDIITRNSLGQISVCLICKIIKPDRCYHCKKCSKCILKRDHHCRWLNNCIGFSNQKQFILFLIYLCSIKLISLITTFNYFLTNISLLIYYNDYNLMIIFFFIFNFILLIPLLLLTSNSLYLAAVNLTSIEIKYPPRFSLHTYSDSMNPFDLNNIKLNLMQVFGNNLLIAFLPISNMQGDGHSFVTTQLYN